MLLPSFQYQLRKAKQSSESSATELAEKVEREMQQEWKNKMDKAVAAAEARWQSKYSVRRQRLRYDLILSFF